MSRQVTKQSYIGPLLRRALVEVGPSLVFFGAFFWQGMMPATAAFMLAAVASTFASSLEGRGLPVIPIITAGIVLVFGGLTLILTEAFFIKVQPTVANGLFALIIASAKLLGYDILKRTFSREVHLPAEGWNRLTWRTVAFLAMFAALNEVIWRSFSTEFCVSFKVFGNIPLNVAFALAQLWLIRSFQRADSAKVATRSSRPD